MTHLGSRLTRVEDEALLRGAGCFIDDIRLPGMLECAFVRSTVGHARLRSVDMQAARRAPGVVAVLGLADLRPHLTGERLPLGFSLEAVDGEVTPFVLAKDEVCFVGEAIAVVIAENRYVAEDAAALVNLDLEVLPAVSDAHKALSPDAPDAHTGKAGNRVKAIRQGYGDVEAAFEGAAHVWAERHADINLGRDFATVEVELCNRAAEEVANQHDVVFKSPSQSLAYVFEFL